jgi:transcriptional regulator with XRE-family HTH domain
MSELGTWLIRAREARGLTLEDAERDTRISRRYLQALEAEQFEVIPAPVYARGFLRSYSQYLGLDPQEVLALFPREEDPAYSQAAHAATAGGTHRPSPEQPASAVGASRPTWRTQQPAPGRPAPSRAPGQAASRQVRQSNLPLEPTIGIDIGVPAPNRRINTDPAAQTRSAVIAIVAVGAIVAVVLLAILISNLGGNSQGNSPVPQETTSPAGVPTTAATVAADTAPGVVPSLVGMQAAAARTAITAAGFKVKETREKSNQPKDTITNQAPAADTQLPAGSTVIIVISDGPS